mmetsp:Transcript_9068/g.17569  ORF Transcript_9068/g.17569 Transcript_9068/m.17569 type:complete len:88 (+) Transcript_9068:252-515(+)
MKKGSILRRYIHDRRLSTTYPLLLYSILPDYVGFFWRKSGQATNLFDAKFFEAINALDYSLGRVNWAIINSSAHSLQDASILLSTLT